MLTCELGNIHAVFDDVIDIATLWIIGRPIECSDFARNLSQNLSDPLLTFAASLVVVVHDADFASLEEFGPPFLKNIGTRYSENVVANADFLILQMVVECHCIEWTFA